MRPKQNQKSKPGSVHYWNLVGKCQTFWTLLHKMPSALWWKVKESSHLPGLKLYRGISEKASHIKPAFRAVMTKWEKRFQLLSSIQMLSEEITLWGVCCRQSDPARERGRARSARLHFRRILLMALASDCSNAGGASGTIVERWGWRKTTSRFEKGEKNVSKEHGLTKALQGAFCFRNLATFDFDRGISDWN